MSHSIHDMSASTLGPSSLPKSEDLHDRSIRDLAAILLEMKKAQDESNRNLLRQLQLRDESETSPAIKAFDWKIYKPENQFHPVSGSTPSSPVLHLLNCDRVGGFSLCMILQTSTKPLKRKMCLLERIS